MTWLGLEPRTLSLVRVQEGEQANRYITQILQPFTTGGFFLFFLSYKTIGNLATIYYNLQRPVNTIEIRLAKKKMHNLLLYLGE